MKEYKMKSTILSKLRTAEQERAIALKQQKKIDKQLALEEKQDWKFARKVLCQHILPLDGQIVNGCELSVFKRNDIYRVSTNGDCSLLNVADNQAFQVYFGVRNFKFSGSDESPEQDCMERAIMIKWWRGKSRDLDEMNNVIRIENYEETEEKFIDEVLQRIKFITRMSH
jgi:hypothetical protein